MVLFSEIDTSGSHRAFETGASETFWRRGKGSDADGSGGTGRGVFRYENSFLVKQNGYYLYYEKNPQMQSYMLEKIRKEQRTGRKRFRMRQ